MPAKRKATSTVGASAATETTKKARTTKTLEMKDENNGNTWQMDTVAQAVPDVEPKDKDKGKKTTSSRGMLTLSFLISIEVGVGVGVGDGAVAGEHLDALNAQVRRCWGAGRLRCVTTFTTSTTGNVYIALSVRVSATKACLILYCSILALLLLLRRHHRCLTEFAALKEEYEAVIDEKLTMPPGYTTAQKQAIAQFMSFTSADRSTAAKILKSHNWDQQHAVNT
ncbi:hypothetical protein GQ43DRAFT_474099 [Delitschia confertaspora ATCC 74209]|uniref:Uncharacterized protein n=1 Tax=Delitschia confertaspora ATCC 74209 TaxID=1513339 RepID=A0A9P4JGD3_9PLEO|nr:hypothetical protein GQ43DRAFT_474099 [Delitschia confertaspora ATCC 74209]